MEIPVNTFKKQLHLRHQQIGMWCTLSSPFGAELLAGAGYDWLLIDTEHSPSEVTDVLAQLQAVAPYAVSAVVRPAWNDQVLIKRYLDIGAQTLLVPFVQDAQEASRAVRSMRYPGPDGGVRGVSGITRASRFGRVEDYANRCQAELCLLVQVETPQALQHIEAITAVDGVDGVFIGPADLAASMGHLGRPGHPDVQAAVLDAVRRIVAAGKPAGVLTPDENFARACIAAGTSFTAVGIDVGLLARHADELRARFGQDVAR